MYQAFAGGAMQFIHLPRLRFSLRLLLIAVTIFMLWGGFHANQAIKERQAEAILKRCNASFQYGPARRGNSAWDTAILQYERLLQVVWRKPFITLVSVRSTLEPDVVEAIASLPYLERLLMQHRGLTEAERQQVYFERVVLTEEKFPLGAMEQICSLRSLKELDVCLWVLSEADCEEIRKHPTLERLGIDTSVVTEPGLAKLLSAPSLRSFSFRWCYVSGEKLASHSGSATLESIQSDEAPVGKDFARFVAKSPKVHMLTVASDTVNNEFISIISDHPQLANMYLARTSVTDQCIPHLIRWRSLKTVVLPKDSVYDSSIRWLVRERPLMKVTSE